jgi:hypothetical protein
MNIGEAFDFIEYLSNKSGGGGYIPPAQRTMLAQRAEIEFVSKYYNNVKQYDRNNKTPIYGYADTQRIYDNLQPYMKSVVLTPNSSGTVALPADYLHPIGFFATYYRTTYTTVDSIDCGTTIEKTATTATERPEVKILTPDKFGFRLSSSIKPPATDYPIAKIEGNVITIAPYNTLMPKLDYIRKPTGAVYNYTQTGNEKPVYVPAGSLPWEAPEDCHNELCAMVLQYVGIHVSGDIITEFARYKEQTGV